MPLTIPDLALILFEYVNVLVAFCAMVLAVQWKKTGFFAGLFFLLLYTIIDAIELSLSAIFHVSLINAAQFGFILLALIGFILGMRPVNGIQKTSKN
jgi:ABC-type multidrug transport system permease subunit